MSRYKPRPADIPRPEPNSDEYDEFLDTIVDMILVDKQTTFQISQYLRFTSGYNYGRTQSYAIAKEAFDIIATIHSKIRKNTVENAHSELVTQLEEAKQAGNTRLALDIQKEINKITGLYKGKEDDQDGSITIITRWGN